MDRRSVLTELLDKSGGRCMHCGMELSNDAAVIEHIFPRRYGGSDRIENLMVVCRNCNSFLAGHSFPTETVFQQYLQNLLLHDPRFDNVCIDKQIAIVNGQKIVVDIAFSKTTRGQEELYIVEVKSLLAATANGIAAAIRQLEHYRSICPNAHFILAVPTLLAEEYRQCVRAAGFTLWDSEMLRFGIPDMALPVCAAPDIYDELIDKLSRCQPGYENWQVYQKLVGEILTALFCPPLDAISEQNADANRANRRDFIIPNYADCGYWPYLQRSYKAEFIVVDAKNAASAVEKDDILQVAHYLKEKGAGLFGLIFSRCGVAESAERHLQDIWQNENKMIIVLSDSDVEQMLLSRQGGNDPCRLIIEKIQEFRLRI